MHALIYKQAAIIERRRKPSTIECQNKINSMHACWYINKHQWHYTSVKDTPDDKKTVRRMHTKGSSRTSCKPNFDICFSYNVTMKGLITLWKVISFVFMLCHNERINYTSKENLCCIFLCTQFPIMKIWYLCANWLILWFSYSFPRLKKINWFSCMINGFMWWGTLMICNAFAGH